MCFRTSTSHAASSGNHANRLDPREEQNNRLQTAWEETGDSIDIPGRERSSDGRDHLVAARTFVGRHNAPRMPATARAHPLAMAKRCRPEMPWRYCALGATTVRAEAGGHQSERPEPSARRSKASLIAAAVLRQPLRDARRSRGLWCEWSWLTSRTPRYRRSLCPGHVVALGSQPVAGFAENREYCAQVCIVGPFYRNRRQEVAFGVVHDLLHIAIANDVHRHAHVSTASAVSAATVN